MHLCIFHVHIHVHNFLMVHSVYRSTLKETISMLCWVCVEEMIKAEQVTLVPGPPLHAVILRSLSSAQPLALMYCYSFMDSL